MSRDIWDNIGRAVTGAADTVGRKTGEVVSVAKLKNQIYSLERDINRDYVAIGKIVYERYAAAGQMEDAALEPLCEAIAQKEILIDEYQGEIDEKKKEF